MALIFNDHARLESENVLLKKKIVNLESLNDLHLKTDSVRIEQINSYNEKLNKSEKKIKRLKKSRKGILIGSGTIITLLTILILRK